MELELRASLPENVHQLVKESAITDRKEIQERGGLEGLANLSINNSRVFTKTSMEHQETTKVFDTLFRKAKKKDELFKSAEKRSLSEDIGMMLRERGRDNRRRTEEKLRALDSKRKFKTEQEHFFSRENSFKSQVWELDAESRISKTKWNDYRILIAKGQFLKDPSRKKPCQDVIGTARHGDWECVVLCDGHGRTGEEVSRRVTRYLAPYIVRSIINREDKSNKKADDKDYFESIVDEDLLETAFDKCDKEVIWDKNLRNWAWVKILGGEHEGKLGQVTMADFEVDQKIPENIENIGVTVFLNAKRKQKTLGGRFGEIPNRLSELPVEEHMIPRKYLLGERHLYGGCTCLAFVRNTKTNMCRVSTAGDSRLMILPGKNMVVTEDDPALIFCARDGRHMSRTMSMKTLGRARSSADVGTASKAMITREHSIDTPAERARLKRDFAGKYIIGSKNNEGLMGYFYPNVTLPYTGGLIPTRGFGNRLYFGSGWTHEPQVSKVITLTPGSLILGSSDGVFDPVLWGKDVKDLVNFVNDIKQIPHAKLGGIAERIYNETSRRCIESDQFRIDDISIFITKIPETKESLDL